MRKAQTKIIQKREYEFIMKQNSLKTIVIGFGDNKVHIHPRMISVAEQDDIQNRFNDIADTDTDKYQKEFEICREALETFSSKPAEKLVKEKGEYKAVPLDGGLAAHFAERTPENERTVRSAYQLLLQQMQPEASFL